MTVLDSSLVRGAGSDRLPAHDKILIVDLGSQVTQLIARRVREEKVYCEVVPFQKADEAFKAMRPKGVILSGGPASVLDQDAPLAPIAMIADEARRFYATQFHLEVVHTPHGAALLRNFVRNIAGCRGDWTMRAFKQEAIEKIRAQVGKGRVICGLSGGVDSAVAAALIHEAIGEQLTCVFVDHGLLRLNEAKQVLDTFAKHMHVKVIHVDASEEFFAALKGVSDPEQKRKIIGK